jgi:hypothetical protein
MFLFICTFSAYDARYASEQSQSVASNAVWLVAANLQLAARDCKAHSVPACIMKLCPDLSDRSTLLFLKQRQISDVCKLARARKTEAEAAELVQRWCSRPNLRLAYVMHRARLLCRCRIGHTLR